MEGVSSTRRLPSTLFRCGLAIVFVASALGLTFLLRSIISTAGYLFFYIAVVASAWFGEKWPGWLAVVLSVLAVEYFFIAPIHSFGVNRESLPIFVEFAVSALVVSWFSSWRRQAEAELQRRVEARTAELKRTNVQLLAEMAERKRAEEAYYEAQAELTRMTRLSAMGALAASISHEVNQPLAAVVTNADACMMWLSSQPPNLEEARAAVDSIAQQGTRASEVVRHIRAMFSKGAPERAKVRVNELIQEVGILIEGAALRNQVSIFQSKDEHENRTGNEEAAQRPTSFLWFLVFRERTVVMVASGRGKVGNLLLVFHFSMDAKPGGGNVGISRFLRDFQGTVESVGNPLLVFHAFHGPGISTALR